VPQADRDGESEYECARAWSALTAAHARISGQLSDALGRGCSLTINDFEILLQVDRIAGHGTASTQAASTQARPAQTASPQASPTQGTDSTPANSTPANSTPAASAAHGAGLRLGELNTSVPLSQPTLSRAVARLADRGLLSRSGTAGDRRGVLVAITPAGQEVLRRAVVVRGATIREVLLSRLTPAEQDLLARALGRVATDH